MAQVLSYESLDRRIEVTVGRSHRSLPSHGNLTSGLAPEAGTKNRLDNFWSEEPQTVRDVAGVAVIVMVGTTPHDEDEIALELRREGLQVVTGPTGFVWRDAGLQPDEVQDADPRLLVNRLLGIVGRRLHGSLHATALTVGQPGSSEPAGSAGREAVLSFGKLTIDYSRREVVVEGQEIPLSKSEFGLLHLLAVQAGRVFTRREMVVRSKGAAYPVTERSIDVHIAAIRRKLGSARGHVQTVRGVGYRFHESPRLLSK